VSLSSEFFNKNTKEGVQAPLLPIRLHKETNAATTNATFMEEGHNKRRRGKVGGKSISREVRVSSGTTNVGAVISRKGNRSLRFTGRPEEVNN